MDQLVCELRQRAFRCGIGDGEDKFVRNEVNASQVIALQVPRKGAKMDAGRFFEDCEIT